MPFLKTLVDPFPDDFVVFPGIRNMELGWQVANQEFAIVCKVSAARKVKLVSSECVASVTEHIIDQATTPRFVHRERIDLT